MTGNEYPSIPLSQPPHDREAETAVLGGLLLKKDAIPDIRGFLDGSDFYFDANRILYEAISAINDRNEPVDIISVRNELIRNKNYDKSGGNDYLKTIYDNVMASANVMTYAKIVREKALLRTLMTRSQQIIEECLNSPKNPEDILRDAEQSIFSVATYHQRNEDLRTIGELLPEALRKIEALIKNENNLPGVSTGFRHLDKYTTGFHGGQLIIIGARPAMGKTTLALNFAQNIGVEQKLPIVIFSLEMSGQELTFRMLSSASFIDSQKLRVGDVSEIEFKRLIKKVEPFHQAPIYISDNPQTTVHELRGKLQRLARKIGGISMVVVDYLQLMISERKMRQENRQGELAEISRGLKAIARDFNLPVVALTQLNRAIENRQDTEPRLADIRESGAIEQDADMVMFLHQEQDKEKNLSDRVNQQASHEPEDKMNQSAGDEAPLINLILAKNRAGPTGRIKLRFFKKFTRFESYEIVDENLY